MCFFARGIYKEDVVVKALAVAGLDLTPDDLARQGREIHRAKYAFKFREGFFFDNLRIPARIAETIAPTGQVDLDFIRKAIAHVQEQVK